VTIWFRNNKAAEKYSEEDIIKILAETLEWVEDNDGTLIEDSETDRKPLIRLKTEVELYLLKTHSISRTTLMSWINKIHSNNESIVGLKAAIDVTLENRLVYDKDIRPNIQALVLQNKHDYREKRDINADVKFAKMGRITKDDEKADFNVGDQQD